MSVGPVVAAVWLAALGGAGDRRGRLLRGGAADRETLRPPGPANRRVRQSEQASELFERLARTVGGALHLDAVGRQVLLVECAPVGDREARWIQHRQVGARGDRAEPAELLRVGQPLVEADGEEGDVGVGAVVDVGGLEERTLGGSLVQGLQSADELGEAGPKRLEHDEQLAHRRTSQRDLHGPLRA